jgi:hypothetical protein
VLAGGDRRRVHWRPAAQEEGDMVDVPERREERELVR